MDCYSVIFSKASHHPTFTIAPQRMGCLTWIIQCFIGCAIKTDNLL